jgi:nucleotide-binding universal stress UspA family protein
VDRAGPKDRAFSGEEAVVKSITHILVATDLTDRSERAFERALQLIGVTGGSALTLVHAIVPGLSGDLGSRRQRDAEAFLTDRMAHVSGQARPNELHEVVVTGDPFSAIIGEGAKRRADLVVIGEPGKQRYVDLFVGTTAERVIRFSDRPVLMVKKPSRGAYSHVLVAFDASEGAMRALETALALAPTAEFRVVHAWWPPRAALNNSEDARQTIRDENNRIRSLVERAAKQALASSKSQPIKLNFDMIENNPYEVMRSQSAWPDLLAMGTHSKGRLATTVAIGNLARHMLAEASCDVLVARP